MEIVKDVAIVVGLVRDVVFLLLLTVALIALLVLLGMIRKLLNTVQETANIVKETSESVQEAVNKVSEQVVEPAASSRGIGWVSGLFDSPHPLYYAIGGVMRRIIDGLFGFLMGMRRRRKREK